MWNITVDDVPIPTGFEYVSGNIETGTIVQDENGGYYLWIPYNENAEIDISEYYKNVTNYYGIDSETINSIRKYNGFYVALNMSVDLEELKDISNEDYLQYADSMDGIQSDGNVLTHLLSKEEIEQIINFINTDGFFIADNEIGIEAEVINRYSEEYLEEDINEEITDDGEIEEIIEDDVILDEESTAEEIGSIKEITKLAATEDVDVSNKSTKPSGTVYMLKSDEYPNGVPIPNGYKKDINNGIVSIQDKNNKNLIYIWVPLSKEELENRKEELKKLYQNYVDEDNEKFDFSSGSELEKVFNKTQEEIPDEFVKSIEKYGGFYVSEAELSHDSSNNYYNKARNLVDNSVEKTKEGGDYYRDDLTYDKITEIAADVTKDNDAVVSHVMYGVEYDAAVLWIRDTNKKYKDGNGNDIDTVLLNKSTNVGMYADTVLQRTSSVLELSAYLNGIWGLGGNLQEITQEKLDKLNIVRGGSWNTTGEEKPLASRSATDDIANYWTGFRVCLYLKPNLKETKTKPKSYTGNEQTTTVPPIQTIPTKPRTADDPYLTDTPTVENNVITIKHSENTQYICWRINGAGWNWTAADRGNTTKLYIGDNGRYDIMAGRYDTNGGRHYSEIKIIEVTSVPSNVETKYKIPTISSATSSGKTVTIKHSADTQWISYAIDAEDGNYQWEWKWVDSSGSTTINLDKDGQWWFLAGKYYYTDYGVIRSWPGGCKVESSSGTGGRTGTDTRTDTRTDTETDTGTEDSLFLRKIDHPDSSYKGHKVNLNESQYNKVCRSIYGEQEGGNYDMYVGLCQYIRDYIDYGTLNRTYDNLGSFWLKRGGDTSKVPSYKNTDWFRKNKPEVIKAVDYVFGQGGSLAQRIICYYYDDDDAAIQGSESAANYHLMNVSCGGGHQHDYVRTTVDASEWSVFAFRASKGGSSGGGTSTGGTGTSTGGSGASTGGTGTSTGEQETISVDPGTHSKGLAAPAVNAAYYTADGKNFKYIKKSQASDGKKGSGTISVKADYLQIWVDVSDKDTDNSKLYARVNDGANIKVRKGEGKYSDRYYIVYTVSRSGNYLFTICDGTDSEYTYYNLTVKLDGSSDGGGSSSEKPYLTADPKVEDNGVIKVSHSTNAQYVNYRQKYSNSYGKWTTVKTAGYDTTRIQVKQNHTYEINVGRYDSAGNSHFSSTRTVEVTTVGGGGSGGTTPATADTTKPVMTRAVASTTSWTNKPVTITMYATDNVKVKSFYITGANLRNPVTVPTKNKMANEYYATYTLNTSGTYKIYAIDSSGNYSNSYKDVTVYIDQYKPTVYMAKDYQGVFNGYGAFVEASDTGGSGLLGWIEYKWNSNTGSWQVVSGKKTSNIRETFKFTASGWYFVYIFDNVGNYQGIYRGWKEEPKLSNAEEKYIQTAFNQLKNGNY